jgi:hypothetical protein
VPVSLPVLLKIVYMLTCRVPGLAVLVIRGDHDAQAKRQRTYPAIAAEA